jgi:hypothetical protein
VKLWDGPHSSLGLTETPTGLLIIRTNRLTRGFWFIQAGVAIGFPIAAFEVTSLASPRTLGGVLPVLVSLLAACLTVDFLIVEFSDVRAVEIDDDGVRFRYRFHSERGLWIDLSPGDIPVQAGMWTIKRRTRRDSGMPSRGHDVTIEQARAILSYPRCPKWRLNASTAQKLGLNESVGTYLSSTQPDSG